MDSSQCLDISSQLGTKMEFRKRNSDSQMKETWETQIQGKLLRLISAYKTS